METVVGWQVTTIATRATRHLMIESSDLLGD